MKRKLCVFFVFVLMICSAPTLAADPVKIEEWRIPTGDKFPPDPGVEPNSIVRFDPRAKNFSTWPVPSGGGVIRHMVSTPQGDIYIASSGVHKVGVVRVGR